MEVKATKQPMMTPFHSTYVAEDQYGMVVTTQLLLHNLPNTGKAPMHPTKKHEHAELNSTPIEAVVNGNDPFLVLTMTTSIMTCHSHCRAPLP